MWFLKNFRRGFATNSSSSHSFVYMKETPPEAYASGIYEDEFGWNDFRLGSIAEKLFYVLAGRIGGGWNTPTLEETEELWEENHQKFPELTREEILAATHSDVDHQSRGVISEIEARDPLVVVFGGNDNSDGSQERARAVRSGGIDWTRTRTEWEDVESMPEDDLEGQAALRRDRQIE